MALILADRVRENSNVQGTGDATLLGSPTGFETFAARIGDGNTTYYTISEEQGDQWEVGVGTYVSSTNKLQRTTILASSNSGSVVSFGQGNKDVFVTLPAEKVVVSDAVGTMAYQNANAVAITGGAIDGTTIGSTTPAAATFTTLIGGKDQVNYGQLTGGATTKVVEFKTIGSDSNVSFAIRPQGTGAIDLAAGSSGVNISNGGTVTAITKTVTGTGYTSIPTVTVSAPTTAGGVTATASCTMRAAVVAPIVSGGTGYTVNDILTFSGGTFISPIRVTVATVSGGVITSVTSTSVGEYSILPTAPISVTGGTGTGATFSMDWGVANINITNAGSGYVEQPTVTFSGGGGSGAAAYAAVGSGTTVKSIGATMDFYTSAGRAFQVYENSTLPVNYWSVAGGNTGSYPILYANGSDTNPSAVITTKGTGTLIFRTNGASQTQMQVSHTANAVNYVQVTGGATNATNYPRITAEGSDSAVWLNLSGKGAAGIRLFSDSSANEQLRIARTASAVNRMEITGAAAGGTPSMSSQGTDTNIDLALTPKGTGLVRFGTYTAGAPTATGYISIKAANGTTYKVLVGT